MNPEGARRTPKTPPAITTIPDHVLYPALLWPEEMAEWLTGSGSWDFQPFAGPLVVTPCESPLVRQRPGVEPVQGGVL